MQKPKKLLATILIANNFINVGIVILFAFIGEFLFVKIEQEWLKFTVEVILATFLILLFGEIIPKIYARRNTIKFSKLVSRPLSLLNIVLRPITQPMSFMSQGLETIFSKRKSNLSVDDLSYALELTSQEDNNSEEHKILKGIVSFGHTETKQVMQPRIDIFALNKNSAYKDVLIEVSKNGYSRIPVYEETLDNIIGILYAKDLLPYLKENEFEWTKLLKPPFFVPENKKLDDLMQEFRKKKTHLAVVVDEYGGTSGVISLEDVMEEIVGDISDEFDDVDDLYTKLDNSNYIFEGKTTLKDFCKILKLEDDEFENEKGEAETLAGLILEIHGVFPRQGQTISCKNFTFKINNLEKKRIKQVHVKLN